MLDVPVWVMTVILMYQPTVNIYISEHGPYATAEACMAQRAAALEAYEDDDPATHVVIGCEPR
jgi:hypothetical protein